MMLRTATVRDLERLTARVNGDTSRGAGARLDAYREGDTFVVDIDLPGVDPAGIDITVDRKVLTVRAERRRTDRDGVRYVVAERSMGTVTRQVFLSETLDIDNLVAKYDTGVLTLTIPVTEAAKPRKVEISAGS